MTNPSFRPDTPLATLTNPLFRPVTEWDPDATLATFHNGTFKTPWGGREVQKCQPDLDRYRAIIEETKPELIIETGTRYGGSTLWFADAAKCPVISIDISDRELAKGAMWDDAADEILYVIGNSIDPAVTMRVTQMIRGARTMVVLDSDHLCYHVWQEIQMYGAMVSPGCILAVEDGCFDFWSGEDGHRGGRGIPEQGGPFRAIGMSLPLDPRFRRREDIEEMSPISHSPGGFWERIG